MFLNRKKYAQFGELLTNVSQIQQNLESNTE